MDDLIRRSDVIGLLEDMLLFGEYDIIASSFSKADEEKAYRAINDIPAVNHWISVEDALPENSHSVLITWVNNSPVMSCYEKDKGKPFTGCAHYCNGKWYWYSQFSDDILSEYGEYQETVDVDVIAWMPMPNAYEPPEKTPES